MVQGWLQRYQCPFATLRILSVPISRGMSSESTANGGTASLLDTPSMAEQLQQKHAASESHAPTIEDTVDEEDILHPPPSASAGLLSNETPSMPLIIPADEPLSEKAIGKQKAQDQSSVPRKPANAQNAPSLDTKSEESFPALGGGPRTRPSDQAPTVAWGSKKIAPVARAAPNGINGNGQISSTASSRSNTPASGILTPAANNATIPGQSRAGMPSHMSMPGRHSERVQFAPSQLLPRKEMKKPMNDVLRDINKRSKAAVEMKPGPGGTIYFEGKGPVDAVRQALKDVAREVGSKVRELQYIHKKSFR